MDLGGSSITSLDAPFAVLAAARCPAYGEMLIAVEREFLAVDRDAVAESLDELARPLFGLEDMSPDDRVVALARAAWAALPEEDTTPQAWLLACGLEQGRATGAVRAALAAELGRRAGVRACAARLRGCWAIHRAERDAQVAADLGADPADRESVSVGLGGVCAHQLAFVVLTGLAGAWRSAGDQLRAQRASRLRLLLPLEDTLRERVQQDVRAHGGRA
jgi:hypothetical protein